MVITAPDVNVRRSVILIIIEFNLYASQSSHYGHKGPPVNQFRFDIHTSEAVCQPILQPDYIRILSNMAGIKIKSRLQIWTEGLVNILGIRKSRIPMDHGEMPEIFYKFSMALQHPHNPDHGHCARFAAPMRLFPELFLKTLLVFRSDGSQN